MKFIHQYMKVVCACATQPLERITCRPQVLRSTGRNGALNGSPVSFCNMVGKAAGIQYGSLL